MTNDAPASLRTRIAFGIGGAAEGIKNNGFDYVLLLYYSQVLGVPAHLVAAALFIALVVDAISDPIVGYWSDNLRTRYGRRHPFMYAAIVPIIAFYYLTWAPPAGVTGEALFPWLVAMTICVRLGFTFYEVPSFALAPELTRDYDGRTKLMAWRTFFGWVGGLTIQIMLFAVWLKPSENDASGFFNVEGWRTYGLWATVAIAAAMLISTLGTHDRIPHLNAPPQRKMTLGLIFREIFETVLNPSFIALFAATLFGLLASGISATLNQYVNGYFWRFTTDQIALLTVSVYLSTVMALILAPIIGRVFGKKRAAIVIGLAAFTLAPAPVVLSLLGLLPPRGSDELFWIIFSVTIFDLALIIVTQMLMGSMVADLVEESEVKTGRRSEGIFFAGISFIRKLAQGSGVLLASIILGISQIKPGMQPDEVPDGSLRSLGWIYAIGLWTAWMCMLACVSLYRISRTSHAENLETLSKRRANEAGS